MNCKLFGLILIIFLIANISASCSEDQIDVNSASISELDKIYGVGEAKAQAIIDSRPYENLDDLVNAYGIGEKTLKKIKDEGLACVLDKENEDKDKDENSQDEEKGKDSEEIEEREVFDEEKKEFVEKEDERENVERKTINLNPKDIKTSTNTTNLDKNNYVIYGFVTFCILLLFLFLVKNKDRFKKNEFR